MTAKALYKKHAHMHARTEAVEDASHLDSDVASSQHHCLRRLPLQVEESIASDAVLCPWDREHSRPTSTSNQDLFCRELSASAAVRQEDTDAVRTAERRQTLDNIATSFFPAGFVGFIQPTDIGVASPLDPGPVKPACRLRDSIAVACSGGDRAVDALAQLGCIKHQLLRNAADVNTRTAKPRPVTYTSFIVSVASLDDTYLRQ